MFDQLLRTSTLLTPTPLSSTFLVGSMPSQDQAGKYAPRCLRMQPPNNYSEPPSSDAEDDGSYMAYNAVFRRVASNPRPRHITPMGTSLALPSTDAAPSPGLGPGLVPNIPSPSPPFLHTPTHASALLSHPVPLYGDAHWVPSTEHRMPLSHPLTHQAAYTAPSTNDFGQLWSNDDVGHYGQGDNPLWAGYTETLNPTFSGDPSITWSTGQDFTNNLTMQENILGIMNQPQSVMQPFSALHIH